MANNIKKSALYIRVSTTHQIDKDSLPFQRKELINYSKYLLGIENYEIFEDAGYSGKNTDRPAFKDMMQRMERGEFTHLLVWKIDRISRNLRDFSEMYDNLKDYGVIFVSKNEQFDTSSAMGEAMLKIILVFAELERKITAERVQAIMLSRAEKGLWNGANCPLGYTWSDEMKFPIVNDLEARTIKYIFDKYQETRSAARVLYLLNENNFKTKRNGVWNTASIVNIIRNPFYKGTYRYNYREASRGKIKNEDEWIIREDNHEAIITNEQWNLCNAIMDSNAEKNTAEFRGNVHTHLFASLLKCGECGNRFISSLDVPRNDGYTPSKYRCRGRMDHQGCTSKMGSDVKMADFVINFIANLIKAQSTLNKKSNLDTLENLLLSGKCFNKVKSIDKESIKNTYVAILYQKKASILFERIEDLGIDAPDHIEFDKLEKEKEKYARAIERLTKLYLFDDNALSEKDYLVQKQDLEKNINELNKKMRKVSFSKDLSQDMTFLQKANNLIVSTNLSSASYIDHKELIQQIDKEILRDFILSAVHQITLKSAVVQSIQLKNGITYYFTYKQTS